MNHFNDDIACPNVNHDDIASLNVNLGYDDIACINMKLING